MSEKVHNQEKPQHKPSEREKKKHKDTSSRNRRKKQNSNNKDSSSAMVMPKLALEDIESSTNSKVSNNANNSNQNQNQNLNDPSAKQQFPKYERPRTARRAPPKLKSNIVQSNDVSNVGAGADINSSNRSSKQNGKNINESVGEASPAGGIILDNDDENSHDNMWDDDDNKENDESKSQNMQNVDDNNHNSMFGMGNSHSDFNNDVHLMSDEMREQLLADAANSKSGVIHGKLVRDILDAQQSGNSKDHASNNGGLTLRTKLGQHNVGTSAAYKSGAMQIEDMREFIQKICRISLPLGKCIDMVFADVDQMKNDCQKWKNKSEKYKYQLIQQKQETEKMLQPLYQQITQIQSQIDKKVCFSMFVVSF